MDSPDGRGNSMLELQQLRARLKILEGEVRLYEQERKVIAYEIHDGLAQELTAALMELQSLGRLHDKDSAEAQQRYQSALRLLTGSLGEMRRLINGLRPPILDEAGVVAAIEWMVAEFARRVDLPIRFSHDVEFSRLATPLENALFRIVQEGLNNALRHGQPPQIEVRLTQLGQRILLVIQDWGRGFDTENVKDGQIGLRGIRERAQLLGGTAEVISRPAQGTTIRVELPVIDAVGVSPVPAPLTPHDSPAP